MRNTQVPDKGLKFYPVDHISQPADICQAIELCKEPKNPYKQLYYFSARRTTVGRWRSFSVLRKDLFGEQETQMANTCVKTLSLTRNSVYG